MGERTKGKRETESKRERKKRDIEEERMGERKRR
jgi:hypothetical protein